MLVERYVTQPAGGVNYVGLYREAATLVTVHRLSAAVAYATSGGVHYLLEALGAGHQSEWEASRKRWLVSLGLVQISEPGALDHLDALKNSQVHVPDGVAVVGRSGCRPLIPFHPKMMVLEGVDNQGQDAVAIVNGSGNVSRNGLTRGHEVGSLAAHSGGGRTGHLTESATQLLAWHAALWSKAASFSSIPLPRFKKQYRESYMQTPVRADDDTLDTARRGAPSGQRIAAMRAADNLWIYSGNLHANRGPGVPGDQLMMSRMTRVFFGAPAEDVPVDSHLGYILVRYRGPGIHECSLRFSNNSMDVLTLPVPGAPWPAAYHERTLILTRELTPTGPRFRMRVRSARRPG